MNRLWAILGWTAVTLLRRGGALALSATARFR
jgi:hypothetical protein